jgi:hypothetical protein
MHITVWHETRKDSGERDNVIHAGATMKFLSALFFCFLVVLGVILLIPILGIGLALALPLGCFFVWLLPILIIAASDRTTGGEKLAWILAIIFLSWFAWIFYFLLAPLKEPTEYRYHSGHRRYRYRYD